MVHVFHIAEKSGSGHEFSEVELQAFQEPEAFTRLFAGAIADQKKRIEELRSLAPSKPA